MKIYAHNSRSGFAFDLYGARPPVWRLQSQAHKSVMVTFLCGGSDFSLREFRSLVATISSSHDLCEIVFKNC